MQSATAEIMRGKKKTERKMDRTRMWANDERDRHPAEYRWHALFNAAKFG